ncbi:MAG: PilZ domain-containing protein [Candidatus Limnocylindrales bacterium]|jgi:c-di-GMP-binding flagellar brake protein YcgR
MTIETYGKPAVHDQVLVEAELDGKVVGLRAVIVNVMPTSLWLGMVRPDTSLAQLRPDQPLHLTFRRQGAAMVAASTFLSHLGASRSRLFSIEWPSDLTLIQRREHLRLDAECPIQFTLVNPSQSGAAGQTGQGTTRNISAGGLQFRIQAAVVETVEVGDELEVRLALGPGAVNAEAEVIRVEEMTELGPGGKPRPPRPGAGPATLVALRFTSISEGAQDKIVRHIFSLQRRRRDRANRLASSR